MTNPRHYLYLMALYLSVVAVVCLLMFVPLKTAFLANWGFNLLIVAALVVGIGINMRQVLVLEPEIRWIKIFRTGNMGISVSEPTRLMKPLAKHLEGLHRDRFTLSAFSMRTVLEGIRGRLDETREVSRYMIGLLVFLGLLGIIGNHLLGLEGDRWPGSRPARFRHGLHELENRSQGPPERHGDRFQLFPLRSGGILGARIFRYSGGSCPKSLFQ